MRKKDWRFVIGFVAAVAALKLITMLAGVDGESNREPTVRPRSAPVRATRPVEEILAYEQAGGPPSDALVSRFRVRLDRIARQCDWSRREASDKLLRMHQILTDEGKQVELLELTIGLDRATRGVATDCHEILATLVAMLGRE